MNRSRPRIGLTGIPPKLDLSRDGSSGVDVALYWSVGVISVSYVLVALLGGRGSGSVWVDGPVMGFAVGWAALVLLRRDGLAAQWVGWAGLATILFCAWASRGVESPVLFLMLLHLSFVERFLSRMTTMWIVAMGCLGVCLLGLAPAIPFTGPPTYQHTVIESFTIVVATVALSGIVHVGRWDERSVTLGRLWRSTESLRAVNAVLDSTRAEALARARQQQALAQLTVHALANAPHLHGDDPCDLHALVERCCVVTGKELGGGHILLRTVGASPEIVVEIGRPCPQLPGRCRGGWSVEVLGDAWGILEVEVHREREPRSGLTMNDRLFVEGVVSLLSAALGQARTAEALREKECQLREARRYEGLAYKASGVVHDLNNALTCILQNTELALAGLGPDSMVADELDDVLHAAAGATEIARHLLDSAASTQPAVPRRSSLTALAAEVLRSHGSGPRGNVRIDCDIADFDGWVPLAPGAAQQVLMNLVLNARQSMAAGGHLMVVVRPVTELTGREMVQLQVADTGPGIPAHIVERIFEPMFTTKRHMGGTGLGLTTVRSIVEDAGGTVSVETAVGEGTTFTVRLPVVLQEQPVSGSFVAAEHDPVPEATILLVEDDPRVRVSVQRVLQRYGYRVLEAENVHQALQLSREHGDELDLLLADMHMTQMTGGALLRQVREEGVDVAAVLVTERCVEAEQGGTDGLTEILLEKPFTPKQLVERVKASLAGARRSSDETKGAKTG